MNLKNWFINMARTFREQKKFYFLYERFQNLLKKWMYKNTHTCKTNHKITHIQLKWRDAGPNRFAYSDVQVILYRYIIYTPLFCTPTYASTAGGISSALFKKSLALGISSVTFFAHKPTYVFTGRGFNSAISTYSNGLNF